MDIRERIKRYGSISVDDISVGYEPMDFDEPIGIIEEGEEDALKAWEEQQDRRRKRKKTKG